jgi:hypothetical protein
LFDQRRGRLQLGSRSERGALRRHGGTPLMEVSAVPEAFQLCQIGLDLTQNRKKEPVLNVLVYLAGTVVLLSCHWHQLLLRWNDCLSMGRQTVANSSDWHLPTRLVTSPHTPTCARD